MKVGDYVRTDKGYITKISKFIEHYTKGKRLGIKEEVIENYLLFDNKQCEIIESIDYSIPPCYPSDEELVIIKSHIVKSSPNIIDLIEEGDYVNGIYIEGNNGKYLETLEDDMENSWLGHIEYIKIYPNEIKSILTKEQFESMEYKIGDKE